MFDKAEYDRVVALYKKDFNDKHWESESYKWVAVKCFQDNWNPSALDFGDMLAKSLDEADNLLTSANRFPAAMIIQYAKKDPERIRSMFNSLFDENEDVVDRIHEFKLFFASTFWKKLQSEIGNSCIAKMALFARMVSGARRRRINPVQTG